MSTTPTPLRTLAPRLAAEFMVIVVGVLVALAVDGWSTAKSEAVLELEYLQRLVEDVEYDLFELEFVAISASASKEAARNLTSKNSRKLESVPSAFRESARLTWTGGPPSRCVRT